MKSPLFCVGCGAQFPITAHRCHRRCAACTREKERMRYKVPCQCGGQKKAGAVSCRACSRSIVRQRADVPAASGHKTCSSCRQQRPLGEFNRTTSTRDGHQYYCRRCQSERRQLRHGFVSMHLAMCRVCGRIGGLQKFLQQRGSPNGHTDTCRDCLDRRLARKKHGG
jgi:hypothetical protein